MLPGGRGSHKGSPLPELPGDYLGKAGRQEEKGTGGTQEPPHVLAFFFTSGNFSVWKSSGSPLSLLLGDAREAGGRGRPAEGVLGGQSPHLSVADFGTRGHLIRADGGGLSPRKLVPPTRARVPPLYTID